MFLTIKELSKEFGIAERNCRYRFFTLMKNQKLVEGEDYKKEDYKDETHFTWRINPLSFGQKANLQPIPYPPVTKPVTNEAEVDTNGNQDYSEVVELFKVLYEDKKKEVERLLTDADKHREAMEKERDEVHALTGALIQKQNRVEELLLLTSGGVVTNPVTEVDTKENGGSENDNQTATTDAEIVDEVSNKPNNL
ncbi:hypothetical protein LCGC14_1072570 [marine sediment metagenome]|uniref:Uncharacterized protein n=1 Tax=marine sediment metagenome TaxID=412755 RepID=A0A0F9QNL3_9ZZZZ